MGKGCDEALFSEKKGLFSEKGGGRHSVSEGAGKDFCRSGPFSKRNSVKRSGPFSEQPCSENSKVAVLIPLPKINSYKSREGPSYASRRYGSALFGPNEVWPFSLELSPSISGKIKERTRFVKR